MTYPETYIIASDDLEGLKLELLVRGLEFKEVLGGYTMSSGEYVTEPSLVVPTEDASLVNQIAKKHLQESVLRLDSNRYGELVFSDGRREYLGKFRSVTKDEALAAPGYTFDPSTGTYYICK